MKKTFAIILALVLVLAMVPAVAFAAGTTKNITTSAELADAILHQADGETWNLAANTTFTLTDAMVAEYAGISIHKNGFDGVGFIFPITANNLTIHGGSGSVITSSKVVTTGNWNDQDFITLAGDNVTLDGLTLIPNLSTYETNFPNPDTGNKNPSGINKTIEVIGKNSTIENIRIQPSSYGDGSFSGSIYYSNNGSASSDILTNVYLDKGRISLTGKNDGALSMTNVTIDYVNGYPNGGTIYTGFRSNTGVTFTSSKVTLIQSQARMDIFTAYTNKPVVAQVVNDGNSTEVLAGVNPTFTITIPAKVDFGTLVPETSVSLPFKVSASGVLIDKNSQIVVGVANSPLAMTDQTGTVSLPFALANSTASVLAGGTYTSFTGSRDEIGSVSVNTHGLAFAGSYKGTMDFIISYQ